MEEVRSYKNKSNCKYIQYDITVEGDDEDPIKEELQKTHKGMYLQKNNNLITKSHSKLLERLRKKVNNKK